MLQRITGMPSEAFGKAIKKNITVSEAYAESEFNPSRDTLDGSGQIGMKDLMDPLRETAWYNALNKIISLLEKKSSAISTPLAKIDQDRIDRIEGYKFAKKEVTKREPLMKRNREAPTIFFGEQTDVGFATVGAIASEFTPRTEFEKQMASVVQDAEVEDAHMKDGARLLELNMISVEDAKDRQNHLAKMRSLLFRHEVKSKHIKKIKSRTYHRLKNKDKLKTSFSDEQMDPDSAKELALKQKFKRAEERMALRHKYNSRWAKRQRQRGLATLDEGTRVAISNQLNQHALLTRKINSMKDSSSSSSDASSDVEDDDDLEAVTEQDGPLKLVTGAKEKTLKIIEEEDEAPTSGVLSLPFMVRGNERRKRAVNEEAKLALKEYDSSLMELQENSDEAEGSKKAASSGRRVFSTAAKNQADEMSSKFKPNMVDRGSDSEDEFASKGFGDAVSDRNMVVSQKTVQIDPSGVLSGSFNTGQEPLFKMKSEHKKSSADKKNSMVVHTALPLKETKEEDEDNGSESGEDMVDGILTSGTKQDYKLPSQADLIHNAFAGDDVEEEFEKEKLEALNGENPEPEKPTLVPGWGQWTYIQKKKGLPSWMVEEHAIAQKKRENALKERKDSHLKHVIISERLDKKAEKLHTATLPHPYTSNEDYEKTLRVPLGPEFNPATKVGALIRPEVVKKPGVIIKPIEHEEVDPHEKSEHKGIGKTQPKKNKSDNGRSVRNTKKLKTKTLLTLRI
ncbi:uncharacterized protein C57A7.06-like isoform X1 [Papaver somniferum]|uniref:uncharacterized protein C57A7.06-like isoform X1 n=1 Tax=Papaver somniferum TaxID=3469 RepID=UPI000E6F6390|nr:uncharacterized protein C57A7.06-like isoform X1 [Papaver somniferum]